MGRYSRLGKNTLWVVLGNSGAKFISFLMLPFYTGWLSVEEYGTVDIINIYVSLLLSVVSCSITEALFVFPKGENREKQQEYFSSSICFLLISIILSGILFGGIYCTASIFHISNSFINHISAIYAILMVSFAQQLTQQFTRSIDQMKIYSTTGLVLTASTIAFSFLLIPRYGVNGFIGSIILANLIASFYPLFAAKLYTYINILSIKKEACIKMLRYSIPLVPNSIMWWLVSALNRPLMEHYGGLHSIGLFAVANKFPSIISSIFTMFSVSWQIAVMEEFGREGYNNFFNKIFQWTVFGTALLSCLLSLCSPLLISIFADSEYYESWRYVPILSLSTVFLAISGFAGSNFSATKESKYFLYSSVWGALTAIAANILLIPRWNIMGASISVMLSFLIMSISRLWYCRKYVKITCTFQLLGTIFANILFIIVVLIKLPLAFKIILFTILLSGIFMFNRNIWNDIKLSKIKIKK